MSQRKKETTKKELAVKQARVIDHIKRIKSAFFDKVQSSDELQCRLDILNSYIEQAMSTQSEIENLDPLNEDRADLEDLCVSTKSLFTSAVKKTKTFSHDASSTSFSGHQSRLPNMRLPKFSGKYSEFKNFISLFENLVDSDCTLSDIEKFNHLISCLTDEALGTVQSYQISESNYHKALASLKKVYDNKCLIFFDNIGKLFNIPEMAKPSASSLRSLIDTVSAIYQSLLSIGDDRRIANAMLINLVMSKVDPATRSKWEEQINYDVLPLWSECEQVLNRRFQHISADEASSKVRQQKPKQDCEQRRRHNPSLSCNTVSSHHEHKCLYCKSNSHAIASCSTFSELSVKQRFDFAKNTALCINCLKKGHTVSKCNSCKCRVCNKSHHSLLHRYDTHTSSSQKRTHEPREPSTSRAFVNHLSRPDEQVLLATAVVKIRAGSGQFILARALLDSGSQVNILTEELAQKLNLKREDKNITISSLGQRDSIAKYKLQTSVKSRINSYEQLTDFLVMRSISGYQPDHTVVWNHWKLPTNIQLADPCFYKPQKIHMLLGAESFFDILCVGQIKTDSSLPVLQKTLLGWVVSGKYTTSQTQLSNYHVMIKDEVEIDSIVKRFWELEDIPNESKRKTLTVKEQQCEDFFVRTVRQLSSGRVQVRLPFKTETNLLGLSYETAKRRFLSLERKLSKDPLLHEMYITFMKEYRDLGHMSLTDSCPPNKPHYFIPHQCVLRPESTTTKLRVVFDGSSKTSTLKSLNDMLMVGPTIQEELYTTLIRFRLNRYALTADITKMYRQVVMDEADRDYQLLLWRESTTKPIQVFRLNTVTYGTSSAPFLAVRSLVYLSDKLKNKYPTGSQVVKTDFYVDDLLTGADTVEELETIRVEVAELLKEGGFILAKWFSNNTSFANMESHKDISCNDSDSTKTLGLIWLPKTDVFKFRLDDSFGNLRATKRNILAVAARLFDPLGLLSPIVIKAKILLQELWIQRLDWDESIPLSLNTSWEAFKRNLNELDSISVNRFLNTCSSSSYQVHGLADASIRAYGCCIYIRKQDADGIHTQLLTAKSRVAPLKTKSLPRLELCAAHTLSKLWSRLRSMIKGNIESVTFWTDSEITLYWIKTHPSTLTTFVGNRVAEIQELTTECVWRHVPSKQNPADIVSRGCNVDELNTSIWFHGPHFLGQDSHSWPEARCANGSPEVRTLETRKTKNVFVATDQQDSLLAVIGRHSKYIKLLHIFVYVYRFINAAQTNAFIRSNSLQPTPKELKFAFLKIVEIHQKVEFADEIQKVNNSVVAQASIQKLNPFIQVFKEGGRTMSLLRVGGRLLNAPIPFDAKFPLLMPKNTHFVTIYLKHLHLHNCHAGPKALIALLRQQIWLINAKEACSKIVRNCVHCFRYKPKTLTQLMGDLPSDRVKSLRPFLISGVDYCGPVHVSLKIRGRPPVKMYIAVFVCFTSKAVHLELVTDLSSNCFISSLKRFIGRRGLPRKIYCDNATNFVGADNKLRELQEEFERQKDQLQHFTSHQGIEFTFIPPRSPHFGGLWEAAVKSAKQRLLRTVGNARLTTEEMQTVLVEVEAVLNSRPIAALSNDPNDGEALTPAHLLIGEPLRTLPPESGTDVDIRKMGCLRRWQLLCALKQSFWRAWSRDYVLGLQGRSKWTKEQPNLRTGALVLVHDDNAPPQQWATGRVVATVTGTDGKVRVADVKIGDRIYRRAIHRLALLPIE